MEPCVACVWAGALPPYAVIEYVTGFLFEFLILFTADKLGDVCRVLHVVQVAPYQVDHAILQ